MPVVCQPFDGLRMASENLGPTLHARASHIDPWYSNAIQKQEYPQGTGLVQSNFEIGRSEPAAEEQDWVALTTTNDEDEYTGTCGVTYNAIELGYREKTFKPSVFGLSGPLLCQDDLGINWNTAGFWREYVKAMEMNNQKTVMHRRRNVYMSYASKYACTASPAFVAGTWATQPVPGAVSLAGVDEPTSEITQEHLDNVAINLIQGGATAQDGMGWINMGSEGPIFPLLIGPEASGRIWKNNVDRRTDARYAFEGMGDVAPLLKRVGANHITGNFRHVPTLFPPRWQYANGTFTRINAFVMTAATKGKEATINPNWVNPAVANVEGAIVLSPNVMIERPLRPMNSAPGQNWQVQNYMGDWDFVTGLDAIHGFSDCSSSVPNDPKHKRGRHIAEFRAAWEPIFPDHGVVILFMRCPKTYSVSSCS